MNESGAASLRKGSGMVIAAAVVEDHVCHLEVLGVLLLLVLAVVLCVLGLLATLRQEWVEGCKV